MVLFNKKTNSLFALGFVLLGVAACGTEADTEADVVMVKVYYNSEWNEWAAARYGLNSVPEKQQFENCEEFLKLEGSDKEILSKNAGAEDGIMRLQEVDLGNLLNENQLIHIADIYVRDNSNIAVMQQVWQQIGVGNGWGYPNVIVRIENLECNYPRSLIAGDILELPGGERYIIDEFGFEELVPVIPAKTVFIR